VAAQGVTGWLRTGLATALTAAALAWAGDLHRAVGLLLYTEQFMAAMLGVALALAYVHLDRRGAAREGAMPWYDAVAALAAVATCFYVAVRYPQLTDKVSYRTPDILALGSILIVLIVEGLRRASGMGLVWFVALCGGWALVGPHVPGPLRARPVELDRLIAYLAFDTNALFGITLDIAVTMVIVFVFLGHMLLAAGGGAFFSDFAMAVAGRFRGGAAKISVVASSLFGTVSGTVVANILVDGPLTISMMHRSGYPKHVAAAIEAVASTGGQIMPPVMGVVAFMMAEYLQVPFGDVVLAAIFPAALYYLALFIQVDLEAGRRGIRGVAPAEIPPLGKVLRDGWYFALPFAVLLGGLFWLNWQPEQAALYATIAVIALGLAFGYRGKRMSWRAVYQEMRSAGLVVLEIVMICAAAGFIVGVMAISGLGFSTTLALVQLGGENLFLLLVITAGLSILLGLGLPSVAIYVLLVVMFVPALVKAGISPMASHMFIYYYGMMSILTPPIAIGAFAAATIANADPMKTAWTSMRIGWVAYVVPFLFVASPSLLLEGDLMRLLIDLPMAVLGVWLVSIGAAGYFVRNVNAWTRVGFVASGLALMVPSNVYFGSAWVTLVGVIVAALLVARELYAVRQPVPETTQ
jgi:TRAP transporter 4TM/12TM fusion protein